MMALNTDAAIDVVARHAIAAIVLQISWEDYPEIGEHDWDRLIEHLDAIAPFPEEELFETALLHLGERAEK